MRLSASPQDREAGCTAVQGQKLSEEHSLSVKHQCFKVVAIIITKQYANWLLWCHAQHITTHFCTFYSLLYCYLVVGEAARLWAGAAGSGTEWMCFLGTAESLGSWAVQFSPVLHQMQLAEQFLPHPHLQQVKTNFIKSWTLLVGSHSPLTPVYPGYFVPHPIYNLSLCLDLWRTLDHSQTS